MAPNGPIQVDRSLRGVLLVAGAVLAARVLYLLLACRYDLIEDEAHYWLWAQHLDWSYYSKGPGVAWAIWASTRLFGDAEWAVRLPSAIAGAIGALAAGGLARDLAAWAWDRAGNGPRSVWAAPARVGTLAALGYALVPALQGASVFMTIDAPYVACWAIACWACWRAMMAGDAEGRARAGAASWWPVCGVAIGVGFLFKYTMLLLAPGLIAFAVWRGRSVRGAAARPGGLLGLGIALALAGLVPVLVWNAQHDWPTVKHLLGHLGLQGGDVPLPASSESGARWSPWWLPELIGEQVGMVGPWLVLGVAGIWRALRPPAAGAPRDAVLEGADDPRRVGRVFLACGALPILLFYVVVSLITEPEGNWPMAAYATLVPLAAWLGADAIAARRALRAAGERVPARVRRRVLLWRSGVWFGVIACVFIHKMDWIADGALALNRFAWVHDTFVRVSHREPRDPAGRLRGAREMAAHVEKLAGQLRATTGLAPFVIAQHYGRASQVAYYTRGGGIARDDILCAMAQTGGRRSQFDLWPQTSLDRADLRGRPAVIVSSVQPHILEKWRGMFERVEPIPGERLRGESKPDRSAFLGFGWRGPPAAASLANPGPH